MSFVAAQPLLYQELTGKGTSVSVVDSVGTGTVLSRLCDHSLQSTKSFLGSEEAGWNCPTPHAGPQMGSLLSAGSVRTEGGHLGSQ